MSEFNTTETRLSTLPIFPVGWVFCECKIAKPVLSAQIQLAKLDTQTRISQCIKGNTSTLRRRWPMQLQRRKYRNNFESGCRLCYSAAGHAPPAIKLPASILFQGPPRPFCPFLIWQMARASWGLVAEEETGGGGLLAQISVSDFTTSRVLGSWVMG